MRFLDKVKNPLMEYRPQNYWGWLENITPEEASWQVESMHGAGLGGYVMHARGGLTIPYMGQQWMDSVRAMIATGNRLGMLNILDDEHGWPSGFGAGHVNGKGLDYWVKWLCCEEKRACDITVTPRTLGVYRMGTKTERLSGDAFSGNEKLVHIYYDCSRYYVDNMDPKVVQEFIRVSYEAYKTDLGKTFSNDVYAIFSDEPQLARYATPWSFILPERFLARNGYDLLDHLPALFLDVEGCEKARYDYWALVSDLFTESYGKQIFEWCSKNGVVFTGHTTLEETFQGHLQCSGNTLPFYEYMTVPGIDFLGRDRVNSVLCKQVSSVAEQMGKERVLSEMYGCSGWNVSMEELKWIAEGHLVLGINYLLQHLGLYSLRGSRKREFPASLFYQQPWWGDYRAINDYLARLCQLLSESQPLADVLVIHPVKTAWVRYQGLDPAPLDNMDKALMDLTETLLSLNVDFHYGDETLLSRHGEVRGGKLVLGRMDYNTVILPSMDTIDMSTLKLLLAFAKEKRGHILSVGKFPTLLEGAPSPKLSVLESLVTKVGSAYAELDAALRPLITRRLVVEKIHGENKWVYSSVRRMDGKHLYFVVNTSLEEACDIRLHAEDDTLSQLDLMEGVEKPFTVRKVHLAPTESLVLVAEETKMVPDQPFVAREMTAIAGRWQVIHSDLNSLTLDTCAYALEDGVWQPEINHIALQERMLHRAKNGPISMRFTFEVSVLPGGELYLVMENPEKHTISLNGQPVSASDAGWWVDKSMRKVDIAGLVRKGHNEIVLNRQFECSDNAYRIKNDPTVHEAEANRVTVDTELESIYLLGNFAVRMDVEPCYTERRAMWAKKAFALDVPKDDLDIADTVTQGYPFYVGHLVLENRFTVDDPYPGERFMLTMDRPDAALVEVSINGKPVKKLFWSPYEADITPYVSAGENTVTLRLVNTCRNLFGPHHHTSGEMYGVSPDSFLMHEGKWTDDYCLVRFGIENGIKIVRG